MTGKLSWFVTAMAASLLAGMVVFGTVTALVWAMFFGVSLSFPTIDIALGSAALPTALAVWLIAGAAYRAEKRLDSQKGGSAVPNNTAAP